MTRYRELEYRPTQSPSFQYTLNFSSLYQSGPILTIFIVQGFIGGGAAFMRDHEHFMKQALSLAAQAGAQGDIPVGALVVCDGQVAGRGFNSKEKHNDATLHAEIIALKEAAKNLGRWRLTDCELYVTLEPCAMCAGALVLARIKCLVYGADDPKAGAIASLYQLASDPRLNHRIPTIKGVLEKECSHQLSQFFKTLRQQKEPKPRPTASETFS